MVLRLSALRFLRRSLSYRRIFPLPPSPYLLDLCCFLPLVSFTRRFRLSPSPLSPRCRGRLVRIARLWTRVWRFRRYLENYGLLVTAEEKEEQMPIRESLGQIIRAERSSNLSRRAVRTNSSELSSHQIPVGRTTGRSRSRTRRTTYGYGGTLSLQGPAASDGHGVVGAVCDRFRGLGLWLGTDALHSEASEGPSGSLARQSKVTVRPRWGRRRPKPDTSRLGDMSVCGEGASLIRQKEGGVGAFPSRPQVGR